MQSLVDVVVALSVLGDHDVTIFFSVDRAALGGIRRQRMKPVRYLYAFFGQPPVVSLSDVCIHTSDGRAFERPSS